MADETYLAFAAAFQAEHHEMGRQVQRLRHALGDDRSWSREAAVEVAEVLTALRAHLKHHFMVEEAGGFLEAALAVAPRFSAAAGKLLDEHPRLLTQLAEVAAVADLAIRSSDKWITLKAKVKNLLGDLVAHETAENRIVQQALNSGVEID